MRRVDGDCVPDAGDNPLRTCGALNEVFQTSRWMNRPTATHGPERGYLCYEYNLFIISRTKVRSMAKLPAGPTTIVVETRYAEQRPAGPLDITIRVGPELLAVGRVPVSAPLLFTANDCFDIGACLGSPVSLDYYDKAPFAFNGRIDRVHVAYI
jgi:arylsulfatase